MPTLSMFFGIIIRMFMEKDSKHKTPHIHAIYSGHEVVVSFDGEILEGNFPANKLKLLFAWIEIHNEELHANWQLLMDGEPIFKIEPLK